MYRDSANLIFANDGHVYADVIIDVRDQFRRIQNPYISHQSYHEPSDPFHHADLGVEDVLTVFLGDVRLGERELLTKEVLRPKSHLQPYVRLGLALHAEGVEVALVVFVLVLPVDRQDVHPSDTRNLEETDILLLAVVCPDVNMVVRELERFHHTVPDSARGRGGVILENHGLSVLHRVAEGLDVGRVLGSPRVLLDALGVTYGAELPVQAALEAVGLVQGLDEVGEHPRLLLGEIDEFLQVLIAGRHADEPVDGVIYLLHGESAGLEGVDVSVYAPGGCIKPLGKLAYRQIDIA